MGEVFTTNSEYNSNITEKMKELMVLKESGLITKDDFETKKNEILSKL